MQPILSVTFAALSLLVYTSTLATAQDLSGVPECARGCFQNAIEDSPCDNTDAQCICVTEQTSISMSVTPCVLTDCPNNAANVLPAAQDACDAALAQQSASGTGAAASASATPDAAPVVGDRMARSYGGFAAVAALVAFAL
ncbi:hypothetical protein BDY21DRAFT_421216 [Lineolata rhizophorae]|uniref:CFEM domain-containing protein n=1 Tax=Lineolata rhizophorae TaxID=578093 RepID=A0A6A6P284_9PEZI|nr:hypothetical protein BDY21DRAFT_421216 [Lineolata rhizophorae]